MTHQAFSFVSQEMNTGTAVSTFPAVEQGGLVACPALPGKPEAGSPEWFKDHHISDEVKDGRPYLLWNTSQELIDYCKQFPTVNQAFVRTVAEQSPQGIIIYRSLGGIDMPGSLDDRFPAFYLPELRPSGDIEALALAGEKFQGVRTKGNQKFWHCHPTKPVKFPPRIPPEHLSPTERKKYPKGKPLTWAKPGQPGQIHEAANMQVHINRTRENCEDHFGVNNERVHFHRCDPAKYVFFPKTSGAKGAPVTNRARAVDIHRLAFHPLVSATRIYFGIEGCIKADAILTELRETGEYTSSSVVSVPSVTLWLAPELDAFVNDFVKFNLAGWDKRHPEIVIVPDADAYKKEPDKSALVRQQALFFRRHLRGKGLDAKIAAPPACNFKGMHSNCVPGKKCDANGIDDFLARGGKLDELRELLRELPTLAFDAWALEQAFKGQRIDRIQTDRKFLEGLSEFGEDDGTFKGWLPQLAAAVGMPLSTTYKAVHRLVDEGVITVDKPLDRTTRQHKMKNGEMMSPFDFEDAVTFTIPPELRCEPDAFQLLPPTHVTELVERLPARFDAVQDIKGEQVFAVSSDVPSVYS